MTKLAVMSVAVLIGAAYIYLTLDIFVSPLSDPAGARAFPFLLAGLLFLGCAVLAVEIVTDGRKSAMGDPVEIGVWPILPVIVLTIAYFSVFTTLGFALSSAIYLLVMTSFFNRGKHVANGVVSISFPVITYLILTRLLDAHLPAGRLFSAF